MTEYENTLALVTGASSGIGRDFARALAARGHNVLVVARREERLLALKDELEKQYGIQVFPLAADLADEGVEQRIEDEVNRLGIPLKWLVNNAGYGLDGPLEEISLQDHQKQMKVMMMGVLELTYRLIPHLKQSAPARIINVSSVASFMPCTPSGGVYSGIKQFVRSFSELLAIELQDSNINVTASCPGLTTSEIFSYMEDDAARKKAEAMPAMDSMVVVEQAIKAAEKGLPVIVHGVSNKITTCLLKILPLSIGRWLAKKMSSFQGEQ